MQFIPALLALIASLGPSGYETEIDPMKYSSTVAAQTAWAAQWGTSEVKAATYRGEPVLRVELPAEQEKATSRLTLDREVKLNLTGASQFHIDIKLLNEPSGERLSIYFHSGEGWYSLGTNVVSQQWTRLRFNKNELSEEGKVAGWDKIDKIRISLWKGENKQPEFLLRNLSTHSNLIGIVVPDQQTEKNKNAFDVAETFESFLASYNIEADRIAESSLATGGLGKRKLAILPLNPTLDSEAGNALNTYMDNGGKLFVCYRIPSAIVTNFGIAQGVYYNPEKDEPQFAAIQFDDNNIDGLPRIVHQNSWNITTGEPVGHHAKSIGTWLDETGKDTNKSAMVLSDRGIYFSHIPTRDNLDDKKAMVIALLGKLEPRLWQEIVLRALEESKQIGDCPTEEDLVTRIRKTRGANGLKELKKAERELVNISSLLKAGQGQQAHNKVHQFRKIREEAFLKGMTSKPREARAFWEHAGTGAYPGDWDRSMKELSGAGINMILPNMLWGDAAHYASDVLPRSTTYEKHGDQIEQCLAAAKKYDIEVHVWKVNFRCSHYGPKSFLDRMKKEGRLQVDIEGVEQPWLNPAHPKNRELEIKSLLEVVRKYDIAGIHFDYIRYPGYQMSFDNYSRALFEKEQNLKVQNWPKDCYRGGVLETKYTNFRCQQITKLVEAVSREAKKIKPQIKISAAVFREQPAARNSVAQDWPLWVEKGYLDFICPMDYTGDDEQYKAWIKKQKELINGKCLLYPGIGASSSRSTLPADRVAGQINITRELGADGYTIFNFNEATANRVLPGLKLGPAKAKAIPPHRQ